jgi:hypothetical protein
LKNAGAIRFIIEGRCYEYLDAYEMRTKSKVRIWEKKYPQRPDYFNFTDFTIGLNNLTHELF